MRKIILKIDNFIEKAPQRYGIPALITLFGYTFYLGISIGYIGSASLREFAFFYIVVLFTYRFGAIYKAAWNPREEYKIDVLIIDLVKQGAEEVCKDEANKKIPKDLIYELVAKITNGNLKLKDKEEQLLKLREKFQ